MNISNLMIGDYVKLSKGNWSEIRQLNLIDIEMIANGVYLAEPIPLQKVHLAKNDFEAREETDDTEFYYYDCYEINVSFDEGISEENIPPIIFLTIEFAEKSIAMPIEYVHELQQAMRVMGCDKKIEL